MSEKRPHIPLTTQLLLWIQAGGRCEFPGCNIEVYEDGLTLKKVNWSNIAHIISWTPNGPRGNRILSKQLATDITNLMLMCSKHAGMIDKGAYIDQFSTEMLQKAKELHEKRIKKLTAIQSERTSHPLVIYSDIGNQATNINKNLVIDAIVADQRWPREEPYVIKLQGNYNEIASQIDKKIGAFLEKENDLSDRHHISIFILATMPVCVRVGKTLGDKYPIELYQRHRDSNNWVWPDDNNYQKYKTVYPKKISEDKDVFIKISLSDYLGKDKTKNIKSFNTNVYEITIKRPNANFLVNRLQVKEFGKIFHMLLNKIQNTHGKDCVIHLLMAVPCPIAIQCGMSIQHRKESTIWAYDYDKSSGGFIKALKII